MIAKILIIIILSTLCLGSLFSLSQTFGELSKKLSNNKEIMVISLIGVLVNGYCLYEFIKLII